MVAVAAVTVLVVGSGTGVGGDEQGHVLAKAARGELKAAELTTRTASGRAITKRLPFIANGTLAAAEEALGLDAGDRQQGASAAGRARDDARSGRGGGGPGSGVNLGFGQALSCGDRGTQGSGSGSRGSEGNGRGAEGNVRVNQDCTYRRQAEEDIVYNPIDPDNLAAGQNDSRVGFNQCGIDFSTNNGRNWGDMLPPFRQKLNDPAGQEPVPGDPNRHTLQGGPGTGHTYDAASDPTVAFDTEGRAFFSCVTFDIGSNASGLYVTMSPPGAKGSFYYNWTERAFTVAEDNSPLVFHDKQFITADFYRSSPNRDNVYVVWTVFKFSATGNYQGSPIYGSMSTDHAIHWSTPEEISGTSDAFCVAGNIFDPTQDPHACNFDQGADPVALPNGDLVVAFNNGNTPAINGQQLAVKCHPTGDSAAGTARLNCAEPSKIGDDVSTGEPQCDFGRGPEECIPGTYVRTNDFPRVNTNAQNGHVRVVWQDYLRRDNGAKEYSIQMAESPDGVHWSPTKTVNPDTGLDHYFPAVDQSPRRADRVGVSYYRTERVPNENAPGDTFTGGAVFAPCDPGGQTPADADFCAGVQDSDSDYVLAGGTALETPYDFRVVSVVFPPPDGIQTGFIGDYSGLVINRGEEAHPIWSDTRNVDPYAPTNGVVHDEDIFTDRVELPNGRERVGPGRIGRN